MALRAAAAAAAVARLARAARAERGMSTAAALHRRKEPNFVIYAYDHKDPGAFERRMEAREAHLCRARFFRDEGNVVVGGSLTDENGMMVGSCLLTFFASRDQVEEFVKQDPYVMRGVWAEYRIEPFRVAAGFGVTDDAAPESQ